MYVIRHMVVAGALALGALTTLPAVAHEAGDWIVKAGITSVMPRSGNGTVGKSIAPVALIWMSMTARVPVSA